MDMLDFFGELHSRNSLLSLFGWLSVAGAVFCTIMMATSDVTVLGVNAWIKPFKFFLSTVFFVWSMAWFSGYLQPSATIRIYNWTVILTLSFELIYITLQAAKGELSHFNISSSFHATMFSLMGVAISIMTLFTAYIGCLFFKGSFPELSPSYLWGIRLGILFFVIFAFEGGIMGAKMAHTVGAEDGGVGIKFLNWSLTHGDLRIAHFAGMHALQVLPILGYYVFTNPKYLLVFSVIFFLSIFVILVQALLGLPLIKQV